MGKVHLRRQQAFVVEIHASQRIVEDAALSTLMDFYNSDRPVATRLDIEANQPLPHTHGFHVRKRNLEQQKSLRILLKKAVMVKITPNILRKKRKKKYLFIFHIV